MIRQVTDSDTATTIEAAEACGLFTPDELQTLRLQLEKTLSGSSDREEFWLADFDEQGRARGVAYCAAETMTDRVWNLLFLGVRRDEHRKGLGSALLRAVEQRLSASAQRMLIIETTSGEEFESARSLYLRHGFRLEATLADFYADGAPKIVFVKKLAESPVA